MTPRGGQAVLRAAAGDGTTTLAGGSELKVDVTLPGQERLEARPRIRRPDRGRAQRCDSKASFTTATKNATVTGGAGARWKVEYAKRRTKFARWPARYVSAEERC